MISHQSNAQVRHVLGRRIRAHRRGRQQTQQALADSAGISRPTLSKLERGHDVNVDSLLSTLRALDLLDGLDLAIAEPAESPIEALGVRRTTTEPTGWTWGDER